MIKNFKTREISRGMHKLVQITTLIIIIIIIIKSALKGWHLDILLNN